MRLERSTNREEREAEADAETGASGQTFVVAYFAHFNIHHIGLAHGGCAPCAGAGPESARGNLLEASEHHGLGFLAGDQGLEQAQGNQDQTGRQQTDCKNGRTYPQDQTQGKPQDAADERRQVFIPDKTSSDYMWLNACTTSYQRRPSLVKSLLSTNKGPTHRY